MIGLVGSLLRIGVCLLVLICLFCCGYFCCCLWLSVMIACCLWVWLVHGCGLVYEFVSVFGYSG